MNKPTIEEAVAILAEATKIFHDSLNREYNRRRGNLKKAGMSHRLDVILPSIQDDVRAIVSLGVFNSEQLHVIHSSFTKWTPPRIVTEVRLPSIK